MKPQLKEQERLSNQAYYYDKKNQRFVFHGRLQERRRGVCVKILARTKNMTREDWMQLRKQGIGGSTQEQFVD